MNTPSPETLDFVRDRVVHVIGHELRTPVTTVRGLAELFESATEEEIRGTLVPALLRNARRAERLLDDLLVAAEISTVRPTEAAAAIDLAEVAAEAVDGTEVRIDGRPADRALAHRDSSLRAIRHLVQNAINYNDGQPSVRFESDDETVTVLVVTPVEREVPDLELGFELFFRGEDAVTRAPGLGVGLAAAKALAQLDDGDVTIGQRDGHVEARLILPRAT